MSIKEAHRTNKLKSKPVDLGSSYSRTEFSSAFRTNSTPMKADASIGKIGKSNVKSAVPSQSYVYGNAVPALKPEKQRRRKSEERKAAPERGFAKETNVKPAKAPFSPFGTGVKMFVCCVFVFCVIGFANISFTSMAVASSTQQDAIQTQIDKAREDGKTLEVEYGTLSNPTTVKEKALGLGMESPSEVMQLNLENDAVVLKDDNTIALCETLRNLS